ncbi:DNA topoisomerase 3 [Senegalia sp. (in: firmicutes)]|uniref:DNA topoisomerase 3 n=1 Tax=Senegalia sp. (in: firmicutes) TaxID=1924098 RepID=UPI003F9C21A9
MKLVIAEKPSVAMSIAEVLGCKERKDGCIEGNGYIISWCIGHLAGVANPESYNTLYSKWKYEDLPILPEKWKFQVFKNTKKQFNILKKLMNKKEVDEIICATDSGREGELIFRLVYREAGCTKSFKRLWISSMEKSAITKGFNNLKNGNEFDNLYKSALARAKADWIVGINATRLFSVLYNQTLSVGRVQTPTLSLIVERQSDINNFKKEKFFNIDIQLEDFIATSNRILDENKAIDVLNNVTGKQVIVVDIKRNTKKIKPPLLFDLTSLQREANMLFGFSAKQTLDYSQSLYEKKWITYPRTDSRYLTEEMKDGLIELIESLDENIDINNINFDRVINDKKVNDHHAIIITLESRKFKKEELPKGESTIYNLIESKLLQALSKNRVEEHTEVILKVDNIEFKSKGKVILEGGFKEIENKYLKKIKTSKKTEKEIILPELYKNQSFKILDSKKKEGFTQPPKHYTEDTLLSAMERAGNEDIDKGLEVEKIGLGTPATRAGIIEKLISVGYIERKGKQLLPTDKAVSLVTIIPDELKSPILTAEWENSLTNISLGKEDDKKFIREIESMMKNLVKMYSQISEESKVKFKNNKESLGKCPRCKSDVFEGKKNYYCSNRDCRFSLFKEDRFFVNKRKKLTKDMVKALLDENIVEVKRFYSEKSGKYYDAFLYFEDTGKYINYKLRFDD